MNSNERSMALEIMAKIKKYNISAPFNHKIDPVKESAPDYLDVIKQPMDFETISGKISKEQYKSIVEWIQDMELVFTNAYAYNSEASIVYSMAEQLQMKFHKLLTRIRLTPNQIWRNRLRKVLERIKDVSLDEKK